MAFFRKKMLDDSEVIIDGRVEEVVTKEKEEKKEKQRPKSINDFLKTSAGKATVALAAITASAGLFVAGCFIVGSTQLKTEKFDAAVKTYNLVSFLPSGKEKLNIASGMVDVVGDNPDVGVKELLEGGLTVNIKYNLCGGSFNMSSRKDNVTVSSVQEFGSLYKATKDYYDFKGWRASEVIYNPTEDKTTANITFAAVFEPTKYSISFTNILKGEMSSVKEYTVESETITIEQPSREGYTFSHWEGTDLEKQPTVIVIPQGSHGNRAYIANWTANEYTVTFKPDADYGIPKVQKVTFDSDYNLPAIEKRGYTLKAWVDGEKEYLSGAWKTAKDITVTPKWEVVTYKLTYDLSGGSLAKANKSSYTIEDNDFSIVNPTRTGYKFVGWTSAGQSAAKTDVVIKKGSIGDIDFKASWKGNPHVVKLDANGGTVSAKTYNVVYGSEYSIPTPTKKGYAFGGWYSGSTRYSSGVWKQDNDVSVRAAWTPNKYSLTLNANGGTVSSTSMTVTYDSSYSLPTPTRTGYTFQGWYNGSTKFVGGTWTTDSAVTLTASWQPKQYTVSLNANGGSLSSTKITVTYGNTYQLPTPYKKGYTFTGWYSGSKKYSSGTWNTDGNLSLSAQWEISKYTVYFDPNGGTASKSSMQVTYGSYFTLPTATRTGYTFDGWYKGSTKFDDYSKWETESDVTLTAKWTGKSYTVSLNANGGSCSSKSVSVVYGSSYSLPTPSKTGYVFKGWFRSGTKFTDGIWNYDGSVTLTAEWEQAKYTITLDAGGGTCSPNSISVTYGGKVQLPTPSRTGFTFQGWYNGSTQYSGGTWNQESGATLVARWAGKQYTVTLDANGGSVSRNYVSVTYASSYSLPEPQRTGYDFLGWYAGNTAFSSNGTWSNDGGVSLIARWKEATYTISLNTNGGSCSSSAVQVTYGSSYSLPTPSRNGYSFDGWYNGSTKYTGGTWTEANGVSLTAHWVGNNYTISVNTNGGSGVPSSYSVRCGDSYSIASPSKSGFTFIGWYYGGSPFSSSGVYDYTKDISIEARYTEIAVPTEESEPEL